MKVWTNNEFEGFYPVGTSAVVIAETKKEAAKYLSIELKAMGLPCADEDDMREVPISDGFVRVLQNGDY